MWYFRDSTTNGRVTAALLLLVAITSGCSRQSDGINAKPPGSEESTRSQGVSSIAGTDSLDGPTGSEDSGFAHLVIGDSFVDLGDIYLTQDSNNHTGEMTFRNGGTQPLMISALVVSCGCVTAQPDTTEVAPGATGRIRYELQPALQTQNSATIAIRSNSIKNGEQSFNLRWKTIPPFEFSPPKADFGKVLVGDTRTQVVQLVGHPHGDCGGAVIDEVRCSNDSRISAAVSTDGKSIELKLLPVAEPGKFREKIDMRLRNCWLTSQTISVVWESATRLYASPSQIYVGTAAASSEVKRYFVLERHDGAAFPDSVLTDIEILPAEPVQFEWEKISDKRIRGLARFSTPAEPGAFAYKTELRIRGNEELTTWLTVSGYVRK